MHATQHQIHTTSSNLETPNCQSNYCGSHKKFSIIEFPHQVDVARQFPQACIQMNGINSTNQFHFHHFQFSSSTFVFSRKHKSVAVSNQIFQQFNHCSTKITHHKECHCSMCSFSTLYQKYHAHHLFELCFQSILSLNSQKLSDEYCTNKTFTLQSRSTRDSNGYA